MSVNFEDTTSSIDTNFVIALLDKREDVRFAARTALETVSVGRTRYICGAVFAELLAGPGRIAADIEACLREHAIQVEWTIGEPVWRLAGERYHGHCQRRRESGAVDGPKRILADFIIGAHAAINGSELITFDKRLYKVAFPELTLRGEYV
jgi:predicted nucleic acid-binding protein